MIDRQQMAERLRKAPPNKTPTAIDLFDVALSGADNAMPALVTILKTAGLRAGLTVADEISANVKCALKVYREQRAQMEAGASALAREQEMVEGAERDDGNAPSVDVRQHRAA